MQANPQLVEYAPDFGIYMRRTGALSGTRLIAPFCKSCFIGRVEDGKYSITTTVLGDVAMLMSLEFSQSQLDQLLSFQSNELAAFTRNALSRQPYHVLLNPSVSEFDFGVIALLAEDVEHNAEESYIPFFVTEFTAPVQLDMK